MPAKHSRHVALTEPLAAWVDEQVSLGEYASASDLMRAAVRLLRLHHETRDAQRMSTGISSKP
ncbi:ribbon-helix-helix domain-containing protein [Methylobacterium sp. Leaf118]|uniref:ribbon-helix-helix domain-containing protein n=1 Tax=Methylobacterium sp. Leaf118 TaxID=2876562 RepID=UPI001E40F811|nr:type II toxin-antitoxin system ParD family antitoxin [Methylobacterium sp. Leaf118]